MTISTSTTSPNLLPVLGLPVMASGKGVMNIAEAAVYLGVHIQTLRRLTRQKKVPGFKVGREWRFRKEVLLRWADGQGRDFDDEASGCSVLVIDDEERVCRALAGQLRCIGCKVRQATSGTLGLELISEEVPDLVLLDLMMPEMNGPMFLDELRKIHPTLPVVIVTGYPDGELMKEATSFAPVMLLSKPVEPELLQRTVRMVVGEKECVR